jgi:GTP-binding protein
LKTLPTSAFPLPRFVGSFPAAGFRLAPARPELAFIGRSNVGKSSLLNALVGRRALARTSRTPGKTRACNVYEVDLGCYFVDLPGYGYARVPRHERVQLARLLRDYLIRRSPAGVVWLLDIRHEPSADDLAMGRLLADHSLRVVVTLTKADQVPRGRRRERVLAVLEPLGLDLSPEQCVVTSARTGEGMGELGVAIERLVQQGGTALRR